MLSTAPKRLPPGYSLSSPAPPAWELGPLSAAEAARLPRPRPRQIGVERSVMQVNFIVPPGTPSGDQPVVVTMAGVPSNTGYINVSQ
ncbi:MAG: hypothetical protein ACLP59_01710 [Bryobacteraceae bacterium]